MGLLETLTVIRVVIGIWVTSVYLAIDEPGRTGYVAADIPLAPIGHLNVVRPCEPRVWR